MQPLLFYSETCPHSRRIVGRLRQTPGADKALRLACVDGQMDRIPSCIDRVPALLVPTGSGNKVVFDTELYEWLSSILRLNDSRRQPPQQPAAPPEHSAAPMDYMPDSDAFLCNLGGSDDSASHLFAGAGEEIRLNCPDAREDTGGRRRDSGEREDDDLINRMMAARNDEISSVYSGVPRPM